MKKAVDKQVIDHILRVGKAKFWLECEVALQPMAVATFYKAMRGEPINYKHCARIEDATDNGPVSMSYTHEVWERELHRLLKVFLAQYGPPPVLDDHWLREIKRAIVQHRPDLHSEEKDG